MGAFAAVEGVCNTPLRFSCDAETNGFLHLDLRNCFTIQDKLANGEPSSDGHQWFIRNTEPWFEIRAKYICHLRNEIVACANVHRNRDNEIVPCANAHRNRDNEIVACANAHRNRDNEIVTCANAHRNRDRTLYNMMSSSSHLR